MSIRINLTDRPITDPESIQLDPSEVGAVLEYRDLVRSRIGTSILSGIDPEKLYGGLEAIAKKVSEEFELPQLEVILRRGMVPIGDARLFVRVISTHTNEAFRAMLEFLDSLKHLETTLSTQEA